MLASVMQRTNEIGVRLVVGATPDASLVDPVAALHHD